MAILCAGHFAERQRFARGSTRMVISLRVILSSMAIVPRSKRILSRRKDGAGGAVARSTLIARQLKGPVIVVFRKADQPYIGLLNPIHGRYTVLLSSASGQGSLHPRQMDHGHLGNGRRVARRYPPRVREAQDQLRQPRSSGCRSQTTPRSPRMANGRLRFGGHFLIDRRLQPVQSKGGPATIKKERSSNSIVPVMITNVLRVLLIPTPLLLHHVSPEYSQKAAFILEMRFSSNYARQVKKIMERCFNMIDQQNSAAHTSAYIDSIYGFWLCLKLQIYWRMHD